jgi:hypothetical protein
MDTPAFLALDCPDCGETPYVSVVEVIPREWFVACLCGANGPLTRSPGEAVARWEAGAREPRLHHVTRRGRELSRERACQNPSPR